MTSPIPFLRPRPPRLSRLVRELEAIEASGIYSNYGPVNTRLETALTEQLFGGQGGCLTVNNATTGLMLAMREAAVRERGRCYALMPSFTFAATAQAALWAGLQPLLCDIDPHTWNACPQAEDALRQQYAGRIACFVPYACFGNGIDLARYARIAAEDGAGLVVDAAASLGSLDADGRGFGAGFPHAAVYSMHVTKSFATAEAGVIHSGDPERLARLRAMGNFGFGRKREATLPGLNAKLSEIGALLALTRLDGFTAIVEHRAALAAAYRAQLPGFGVQQIVGSRLAYQFMPVLLPPGCTVPRDDIVDRLQRDDIVDRLQRDDIVDRLQRDGIGVAHYFSPHLAEQAFFAETCVAGDLPVTRRVASRVLSLPMADTMDAAEVTRVCQALRRCAGA